MRSKREIREVCREASKELTGEYKAEASRAIERAVLSHPAYRAAETVFVYFSLPSEPDTRGIIAQALRDGKRVCVPRCREKPQMDAAQIHSPREMTLGPLGIPEPPADAPALDPQEIGLALVPCLAAGKNGSRLGHGAGYYDAFLARSRAAKICLCFGRLLRNDIPMTAQDIWMDGVITEEDEKA